MPGFQAAGPAGRYVLYRGGCYLLNPDLRWEVDQSRFLSVASAARAAANGVEPYGAISLYKQAIGIY